MSDALRAELDRLNPAGKDLHRSLLPRSTSRPTQDRANAIAWASSVVADPRAVVVDTETTSLDMATVEICDLTVLAMDGTILLDTYVRPLSPIPAAATAVHGIGESDVAQAPRWSEILPDLIDIISGRRVVAWNADYDREVIAQLCRRMEDMPEIPATWECAMKAFGAFDGTPSRKGRGYKWFKLSEAAARFGIEPGTHRALADTEATRQIVLAMSKELP